jgi:hypothetical protein
VNRCLVAGEWVRVRLAKKRGADITYKALVLADDGCHVAVRARWSDAEARDLGFARFEPGDLFTEHYWRDRWYSIKEVRDPRHVLKGWYCDVARPVRVRDRSLLSEDLELDLWVSADGRTILRLDEAEFAASHWTEGDPIVARRAWDALAELETLAEARFADAGLDLRPSCS